MPGLYSVQAVAADASAPDVTVFFTRARDAVDWIGRASKRGVFEKFLLRHAEESWDVYDRSAKFETACSEVLSSHILEEQGSDPPVIMTRDVNAEVAVALGHDRSRALVSACGHAEMSSANHSNFTMLCRKLILESSADDLRCISMVDSRRWGCRVAAVAGDVSSMSPGLQDSFLDMHRWLSRGWPLNGEHFTKVLAERMVRLRARYVADFVGEVAAQAGYDDDQLRDVMARWSFSSSPTRYDAMLRVLTSSGVEILGYMEDDAPDIACHAAETLRAPSAEVARNVMEIVASVDS